MALNMLLGFAPHSSMRTSPPASMTYPLASEPDLIVNMSIYISPPSLLSFLPTATVTMVTTKPKKEPVKNPNRKAAIIITLKPL